MLQLQGSSIRLLAVKHPESADTDKLHSEESFGILGSATKGNSFLPPTLWNLDDAVDSVAFLRLIGGGSPREGFLRCRPQAGRCTEHLKQTQQETESWGSGSQLSARKMT